MKPIVPGVFALTGPLWAIPTYAVADADGGLTLIDTGLSAKPILDGLRRAGRSPQDVRRILITHAHPDHVGGLAVLAEATGAPVFAGAKDAPVIRGEQPMPTRDGKPGPASTPARVDVALHEGDVIPGGALGGLVALETPGHTPGHVVFWAAGPGVLFVGDVLFHVLRLTQPPRAFTLDEAQNRASTRRIAALDARVALFGHGAPFREGAAAKLRRYAAKLPLDP